MPSSYKQWSTASTSYVRSSIVAGQGGGTTQNLTTFSGHPMSLTTWYVPDSVPEFLDIGDIRAIGHSGVANTSWFEIEITSRSAEFKTVTLENSPANLNCAQFRLIRSTSTTPLVNFVDGARLTESDLDKAYRQGLFAAQEVAEDAAGVGNLASLNLTLSGTTTVDNLTASGTTTVNNLTATGTLTGIPSYSTGTWTPTLTGAGGGSRPLTGAKATYTKIGRLVHVHCTASTGALTGSNTGTAIISGLPFDYVGSVQEALGKVHFKNVNLPSGIVDCSVHSYSSGTDDRLFFSNMFDNSNHGELGISAFTTGSEIRFVVMYTAAS